MNNSQRVLVNTVAQYIRTAINIILSLFTVRIVLQTLGESDFGIYTLIGGVISMLSFLTNTMINSTQRFISYYQGKNDNNLTQRVFNTSNFIHIVIGIFVVLILEMLTPLLFNGFLNIPEERNAAARTIYHLVAIMLFFSFSTSPYKALITSHENIVYISIIEILDAILKVVLVIIMTILPYDKLIIYGYIMLFIQVFNYLALRIYSRKKYIECIPLSFTKVHKGLLSEILSFAGWNAYGTGCQLAQKEGLAIVLNRVMGAAVNSAYGIGFQVAGYMGTLSYAITNAIRPQITKAEGGGDREHALWLSNINSKAVFFLMSMLCIPCIFEIKSILSAWLVDFPMYTDLFCIMAMLTSIADSFTIGLTTINSAIGNIKRYTIIMNTPKLLVLPASYILLLYGFSVIHIAFIYIGTELIMAFIRIKLVAKEINLNVPCFFRDVIGREILPTLLNVTICAICVFVFHFQYRFIFTFCLSILFYSIFIYYLGLTSNERHILKNVLVAIKNRFISIIKNTTCF